VDNRNVNRRVTVNPSNGTMWTMTPEQHQNSTSGRTRKSVDHTLRHGIRSMLRCVPWRDDFDVPDLSTLADLSNHLDDSITAAVANLRGQGHSWQTIAGALGTTRQAAHKRYAAEVQSLVS